MLQKIFGRFNDPASFKKNGFLVSGDCPEQISHFFLHLFRGSHRVRNLLFQQSAILFAQPMNGHSQRALIHFQLPGQVRVKWCPLGAVNRLRSRVCETNQHPVVVADTLARASVSVFLDIPPFPLACRGAAELTGRDLATICPASAEVRSELQPEFQEAAPD